MFNERDEIITIGQSTSELFLNIWLIVYITQNKQAHEAGGEAEDIIQVIVEDVD